MKKLESQKAALDGKLGRLEDDFRYNLELLDGRDAELHSYDDQISRLHDGLDQTNNENEKLNAQLCCLAQGRSPKCWNLYVIILLKQGRKFIGIEDEAFNKNEIEA